MCLKMQLHPQTSSTSHAKEITRLNSSVAEILESIFYRFMSFSVLVIPCWRALCGCGSRFGAILLDPVLHKGSADDLVKI